MQPSRGGRKTIVYAAIVLALLCGIVPLATLEPPTVCADDERWTAIGPWGGVVYDLDISPTYAVDHTLFVATRGGGMFVSDDGGASWRAVNRDLPTTEFLSVGISPDYGSDRTTFAGTADAGL